MLLNTICSLLLLAAAASARRPHSRHNGVEPVVKVGECPDIQVYEAFNQAEFPGTWYPQLSYPTHYGQHMSCVNLTFTTPVDGSMNVTMKGMKSATESMTRNGILRAVSGGKLEITMGPTESYKDFWVVARDQYSGAGGDADYVFVWSCRPHKHEDGKHVVYAWIMTRQQEPSAVTVSGLLELFRLSTPAIYHHVVMIPSSHHHN